MWYLSPLSAIRTLFVWEVVVLVVVSGGGGELLRDANNNADILSLGNSALRERIPVSLRLV